MNELRQNIRPLSWILLFFYIVTAVGFSFQPSLSHALLAICTDRLAEFLKKWCVQKWIYSQAKIQIFFQPQSEIIESTRSLSETERIEFILAARHLPQKWAIASFFICFVKAIPAYLVMMFVWPHSRPIGFDAVLLLTILALCYTYFAGMIYIESHRFLTQLLEQVHQERNWAHAFNIISHQETSFQVHHVEKIIVGSIVCLGLLLQSLLLYPSISTHSHPNISSTSMILNNFFIGLMTALLYWRFRSVANEHMKDGFRKIFSALHQLQKKTLDQGIALDTTDFLGKFDSIFNDMTLRLRQTEQELAQWIAREHEKSRFKVLGEMSALIAHDMRGPLNTGLFCVEKMKESPMIVVDKPDYLVRLDRSLRHIYQLTENLRDRLKGKDQNISFTRFLDCHENVLYLLKIQFFEKGFDRIQWFIDGDTKMNLPVHPVDLTQILDNLYRNSVQNLLKSDTLNPKIMIELTNDQNHIKISISDNGMGLSKEHFYKMTDYQVLGSNTYQGLGLKLSCRLAEQVGGKLMWNPSFWERGTTLLLEFPRPTNMGVEYARTQTDLDS
jgi:signal transduction histidine kinase